MHDVVFDSVRVCVRCPIVGVHTDVRFEAPDLWLASVNTVVRFPVAARLCLLSARGHAVTSGQSKALCEASIGISERRVALLRRA